METRPGRRHTGKKVAIAGVSGVIVLALAGAIVWLTPSTPTPRSQNLAAVTTPSATAEPSRTSRPKRTRASRATRTSRPVTDPASTTPTTGRPTTARPTATRTTARPTATRQRAGGVRLLFVRTVGSWHVDPGCYAGGSVALQARVERSGSGVIPFRYTWYFDGRNVGSGSANIVNDTEQVNAPREMEGGGGSHTATFRITSPVSAQKSVTFEMCQEESY